MKDLQEKIKAKLAVAEEFHSKGDYAAVAKILDEVKSLRETSESESAIKAARATLDGENAADPQTKPVTQVESETDALNQNGAAYRADFEPAGYVKGLPAAIQTNWVREKMGDNLKAQSEHYKSTWTDWFRSRKEGTFWAQADAKAIKAMQEGTDNEGGYFVPEEYRDIVIHNTGVPGGVHRPHTTQLTTGLKDGYMPTIGGVTWAAIAEEAAYGDNTPTIGQVSFTIRKSGGTVKVSAELLEDSQANLPGLLSQIFGESSGRYEDQQIIEGDGTTEPEGLRTTGTDSPDITITTPTIQDFLDIYWDLPAQFRTNAVSSVTSSLLSRIGALDITSNKGKLTEAPVSALFGRPIATFDGTGWDNASTMGASEEYGAFGDFRNYYLIDRIGMSLRRDDSIYVANDQVGFFARRRFDGRVGLADAFRVMKGAAS